MQFPNTHDTILAVASPWRPSPIGIVRLSGPRALAVVESLITGARERPAGPRRRGVEPVSIAPCPDVVLPADVFRFPGPHSATGQDVAEIHAPGNLPLLRALLDRLVAAGARRALPGEFTARAYLNGKIDAAGAAAVLELIHATDASAAQAAMRLALGTSVDAAHVETRLLALLARIEADIDFVDEEDVSSLSAAQVRGALTTLIADVDRLRAGRAIERRHRRPHVALVGLPNAGKSTLFNALLGRRRAIVAPLEGTTRDVLSAEIELGGREIVLQDCAGLGSSADEIELAAHRAAEQAADFADAIVWVHDAGRPWGERERGLLARFDAARTIVVLSKLDECESDSFADIGGPAIRTSAVLHNGLTELSSAIAERIGQCSPGGFGVTPDWTAVAAALGRAAEATGPELIAIDVRGALSEIRRAAKLPLAEDVLGFIFTQFCIGK